MGNRTGDAWYTPEVYRDQRHGAYTLNNPETSVNMHVSTPDNHDAASNELCWDKNIPTLCKVLYS